MSWRRKFACYAAVVATAILAWACAGCAQSVPAPARPDTVYLTRWGLPPHTWAITYCQQDGDTLGVHVAVNAATLVDTARLDEVMVHEAVHVQDMLRDRSLCNPTWHQLLAMEVHAYSVSVLVEIKDGLPPARAYVDVLNRLSNQFAGTPVSLGEVAKAWYDADARLLGLDSLKR